MSWRTVIIESKAKLSYKNDHLVIRADDVHMVHLSEIAVVLVESTAAVITSYLISELSNWKIPIIFCDTKHMPISIVMPIYSNYKTSERISNQVEWEEYKQGEAWRQIVKNKILNQALNLQKINKLESYKTLMEYYDSVQPFDQNSREGAAAKLYFKEMFGDAFIRHSDCDINVALDYGYTILLSYVVRSIVSLGYITQLGINHKNSFNPYNLASDLMEPFRPIVDFFVYENINREFDSEYKRELVSLMNEKVNTTLGNYYINNAIQQYVQSIVGFIEEDREIMEVYLHN